MNTRKFVFIITLLFVCIVTFGSNVEVSSDLKVKVKRLEQIGDSLYLEFSVYAKGDIIKSYQSVDLTPVIKNGDSLLTLPFITFNGINSYKVYKREFALRNKKKQLLLPYLSIRLDKNYNDSVFYSIAVPFQKWMEDAYVSVNKKLCDCDGEMADFVLDTVAVHIKLEKKGEYVFQPQLAFIMPLAEPIKNRFEQKEARLNFQSGKYSILPGFMNNANELAQIDKTVTEIKNDKNVNITGIKIVGYCSPEGSFRSNDFLAKNRAIAVKDYIKNKYNFSDFIFNVDWVGEDWQGLEKLVDLSQETWKDEVLNIIKNNDAPDVKDKKLVENNGWQVYKVLLSDYFPLLRRVVYKIDYNVKDFTIEEGKVIIKTHPKQLSLNEMIAIANTYEKGSAEFNEVFGVVVKYYPDNPVANINSATAALFTNDLVNARKYLQSVIGNPLADNVLGVILMLEGDFYNAEIYLKRAEDNGNLEAGHNLEQIRLKKEYDYKYR